MLRVGSDEVCLSPDKSLHLKLLYRSMCILGYYTNQESETQRNTGDLMFVQVNVISLGDLINTPS